MVVAERQDQGLTLLHFLRCLPPTDWLRRSILWADDLAVIWPENEPTPFTDEEEQSRREIDWLREAGFFRPEYISTLRKSSIRKALETIGVGDPPTLSDPWINGAPAVGRGALALEHRLDLSMSRYRQLDFVTLGASPWVARKFHLPENFVYPKKFSREYYETMLAQDLIQPSPDDRGFIVADLGSLERLLSAAACVLHESSHGRLIPDVTIPSQARIIAAPPHEGEERDTEVRDALVLAVRGAMAPNLQTDFQRFIDFRLDDKNERARQDYVVALVNLWKLCSDGGTEHALEEVVRKVALDARQAGDSYFKRVGKKTLVSQGLTSFAAVIPLAIAHPPALIVAALSAVGASAIPLTVRKGAPKYVRSASAAGLLASTASL